MRSSCAGSITLGSTAFQASQPPFIIVTSVWWKRTVL